MKALFVFAFVVCYVAAAGQWEDIDVNDEKAVEMSRHGAELVNGHLRSRYHYKLIDFVKARRQVVAGFNYEVKIVIQETSCAKTEKTFEEAKDCDARDGGLTRYCTVRVWEKSWEHKLSMTSFSCSTSPFDDEEY
ncbi:L-cystatin-like [Centruroides vittatus]|uniref:L-cystatin-like n=1 Tax=Centruroides vittatus TaxID=120091 RepID=UPI003510B257